MLIRVWWLLTSNLFIKGRVKYEFQYKISIV
jgi:hypothetical protein